MAQTAAITANTTAQTSSDIVVTTTPIQLTMYSAETNGQFGRVKIKIEVKVGSNYLPLQESNVTKQNSTVFLFNTRRGYTLTSPGTYRLVKDATDKSVGVYQDTTA